MAGEDAEPFAAGMALFPKDGRYLIPLKDAVRRSAGIELDQVLTVEISVGRG